MGDEVVFIAKDLEGEALWKSNGTSAGTVKVKTFTGSGYTYSDEIFAADDYCYVFRRTAQDGQSIWYSDGTEAGTEEISGVTLGHDVASVPNRALIDGNLYFSLSGADPGTSIFRIDANTAAALPLRTADAGASASFQAADLTPLRNSILFSGWNSEHGHEPWVTDGTPQGTRMLLDMVPGTGSSNPGRFANLGDKAIFSIGWVGAYGIAVSDGTPSGTKLLIEPELQAVGLNPLVHNGIAYFMADPGPFSFPYGNSKVYRSDGTSSGTYALDRPADITPHSIFRAAGDTIYFPARSAAGAEIWKAESTTTGISMVKDIYPGSGSSHTGYAFYGFDLNGELYFPATHPDFGNELWKTDGTATGTVMVVDAVPGPASSNPIPRVVYDGRLYFVHLTEEGWVYWTTDKSGSDPYVIHTALKTSAANWHMGTNTVYDFVIFTGGDAATGNEPWITNGTIAGTSLLGDINPGAGSSVPSQYRSIGNLVYFIADDGIYGDELWVTDGTAQGTRIAADINPGAAGSEIGIPVVIGTKLVFTAVNGISGRELWIADSQTGDVYLAADVEPGPESSTPSELTSLGTTLIYQAYNSNTGMDLWALPLDANSSVEDWALFD
jgi:ELWxxDGT repeat protein